MQFAVIIKCLALYDFIMFSLSFCLKEGGKKAKKNKKKNLLLLRGSTAPGTHGFALLPSAGFNYVQLIVASNSLQQTSSHEKMKLESSTFSTFTTLTYVFQSSFCQPYFPSPVIMSCLSTINFLQVMSTCATVFDKHHRPDGCFFTIYCKRHV